VSGVLPADATWSGTVEVADDLLVPAGRTLRIAAGTRVLVRPADTTRTDPEYLDNATEILVRGRLLVAGSAEHPVLFLPVPGAEPPEPDAPAWGGIIFDGGGGRVAHAAIAGAGTGVTALRSSPRLEDVDIEGGRFGVAVGPGAAPELRRVRVRALETGIVCWPGSRPRLEEVDATGAEHEGLLAAAGADPRLERSTFGGGFAPQLRGEKLPASASPRLPFVPHVPPAGTPTRSYHGESFIGEETRWEGEVLVDGTVMVAPVARLVIAPGTVVRFTFRDTNGDGIGENELFVQGVLRVEGTAERPVVFTAADGEGPGRWGAVNLMGTDAEESLLSHCLVEKAYRGLHSHFSRFRVEGSVFRENWRSIQFQESTASVTDTAILASASGMRFRDSTVELDGLAVAGNGYGIQTLRSTFTLAGSTLAGNVLAALHVRESEGAIVECEIRGNGPGVRVSDSRLRIERNRVAGNLVGGLLLRRTEALVEGNAVTGNVGNGVSTDSPAAAFHGNAVAGNLRWAVENNSPEAVDATGNWWGTPAPPASLFFDRANDPAVGPVLREPALLEPPR